ncbi:hypothetical protein [Caballeronia calidae]|uniref:hypothetical protein n=1 Tax=Caballeronia calidae TaxID=1777139 RepID=UPI000AC6F009|nr:hypothetical protein [Caballeronia calidae]
MDRRDAEDEFATTRSGASKARRVSNSLRDTLQGNSDENQLNLSCLSAAHFFNPPSIKIRHPVPIYRLMHWKIRSFSGQLQAARTPTLGTTVLIHTRRGPDATQAAR